jgi:hypothetical protein
MVFSSISRSGWSIRCSVAWRGRLAHMHALHGEMQAIVLIPMGGVGPGDTHTHPRRVVSRG